MMQLQNFISPDKVFIPADIGTWRSYQSYTNKEQIALQRENLVYTGLCNGKGDICFIFTDNLSYLNKKIQEMSSLVKVENTETTVEDEVFYTTKIEGANTTRKRTSEIHNGAKLDKKNKYSEQMVKNSFNAVKLLNLYSGRLNEEILLKVWNVLVQDAYENRDIRGNNEYAYRTGNVEVGSFEGASFQEVCKLMDNWITFYNSKSLNNYPFIKAALLHFAFETIHPFCDGNGRMGRLLINNYLIGQGIESARAVSFSMQIDARRPNYDAAFLNAENLYNDCTPFLEYMLEVMYSAYETALSKQFPKEK